jgi:quercetin dioxygenase-like cupin family protein
MTARANFAGFLITCFNPATAPAFLVAPSMTEASSSTSPMIIEDRPFSCIEMRIVLEQGEALHHHVHAVRPVREHISIP